MVPPLARKLPIWESAHCTAIILDASVNSVQVARPMTIFFNLVVGS